MGYIDYSAAFAYKDLLTYQKLNQLGANDAYFKAAVGGLLSVALGVANLKLFINAAGTAPEFANGIKIGTFTRDTAVSDSSVAYSGIGFKPSHIIIIGNIGGTSQMSIGFSNGTDNYNMRDSTPDSAGTYDIETTKAIWIRQADAINYKGTVTWDSDGFTIAWTLEGAKTGTATFIYIAFR